MLCVCVVNACRESRGGELLKLLHSFSMDTPERNQIAAPLSRFEDSPVFNYINSLSPIKPVKSIHITHTFNSLNFASIPSVFTSPHVSNLKESRFLRRHNLSDQSKPEFASDDGNKEDVNLDAAPPCDKVTELQTCSDSRTLTGEESLSPFQEHEELAAELHTVEHECGKPKNSSIQCHHGESQSAEQFAATSISVVSYAQKASMEGSVVSEDSLKDVSEIEPKREGSGCDWESLMSDSTDLLIFDSPNESQAFKELFQQSVDPGESFAPLRFTQDDDIDLQRLQLVGPVCSDHETQTLVHLSQHGESNMLLDLDHMNNDLGSVLNECMGSMPSEKIDNEPVSNLYRGVRRRCLVFEAAGSHRKKPTCAENSFSSTSLQSIEDMTPNDGDIVPVKPDGSHPSRRLLPGIGLHLNSLAKPSRGNQVLANHDAHTGVGGQSNMSISSFGTPTAAQESLNSSMSLGSASLEKETNHVNGAQNFEDDSQVSDYLATDEFNQRSPKKKRRKVEDITDTESCKRCNCKKSKCLKLYCECFAAGVYCIEPCSCQDCFNKPIHEDTVLATRKQIESRNPLAFAPKVIISSETLPDIRDETSSTPASARHKRGCNCKKSGCLKKYCECYQSGVGCSINCRCEGCKNAFGRKDGSVPLGTEVEEDETEKSERNMVDQSLQGNLIPINEEPNTNSLLVDGEDQSAHSTIPATPFSFSRLAVQLPFSSKGKPPRSTFLAGGSSSGLQTSQRFGKPNFIRPQTKLEKSFQASQADDMPEILQNNSSPSSGIKTGSPNSKRVSPPHCDFGTSPERRGSRKLILQSIPSFPSLNQP